MTDDEKNTSEGCEPRILEASGISKFFQAGENRIDLFADVCINVGKGELVSITGRSGSGKSTLLYILSSLLRPDSGVVRINGRNIYEMRDDQVSEMRNREIGFVFQNSLLLDELTLRENILLPIEIYGNRKKELRDRIIAIADEVGIYGRLGSKASQVSGGERSRAALLRALAVKPALVFLDEPTGSLDNASAAVLENLIVSLSGELDTAFVYVTHDLNFAARAISCYEINNGVLQPKRESTC